MRIAQLAPLIESVPPTAYGGIELVVSLLTERLVQRGHDVTLFASGDSVTGARLVSVVDKSLRANPDVKPYLWMAYDFQSAMELVRRQDEFDIVHNHMGWQALPLLSGLSIPVITTNHNLIEPAVMPIYRRHCHWPFIGISNAYVLNNGNNLLNYIDVIYNGIEAERYHYEQCASRNYLCFLGRLCHDKGIVEAILMAKRLCMPLVIAGKVDPSDRDYFEANVKPLIDNKSVQYIGEVGHQGKLQLFQNAYALLYPINFDEPFGLVMVEALACGVPVVALRRGSIDEVLTDDTAIVGDTIDELVDKFHLVSQISRLRCRQHAESSFSAERMVDRYEAAYQKVLTRRQSQLASVN